MVRKKGVKMPNFSLKDSTIKTIFSSLFIFLFLTSCSHKKVIIAHRGASGVLPEHTLQGVAMAHAWGVDFIEPDIVLSKDDEAIVLHDIYLESTTNVKEIFPKRLRSDGHYYAIDFSLEEIKRLQVSERINPKTGMKVYPKRFPVKKSSFKVPTLKEYIELVQGLNKSTGQSIGIYPEIKRPSFHKKEGKDITSIVMKILNSYGYLNGSDKVFVQCFEPETLKRIRRMHPKVPLVQLIGESSWFNNGVDYKVMQTKEGLKKIADYAQGIGPWIGHIYKKEINKEGFNHTDLVKLAHERGLLVHAYTLRKDQIPPFAKNYKELLEKVFLKAKVDGAFTDHVLETKNLLKEL